MIYAIAAIHKYQKTVTFMLRFPLSFLAVNQYDNKNWVPSILTHNLWLIFMGMKQKKIQKNSKNQNGQHRQKLSKFRQKSMPFASINPTIPRTNPWKSLLGLLKFLHSFILRTNFYGYLIWNSQKFYLP